MTPAIRRVLDAHLTRPLCPKARERARALRRAMCASWPLALLRAEYVRVLGARQVSSGPHHYFLGQLLEDLRTRAETRAALEAA